MTQAYTNANAKLPAAKGNKKSTKDSTNYNRSHKRQKSTAICFAADSSASEDNHDSEVEADTEVMGGFSTKLRHFDPLGKEPWNDYIIHFTNCAKAMSWPRKKWAVYLGTHLKGKAMKVYSQIPEDKLRDFDHVVEEIGKKYTKLRDG